MSKKRGLSILVVLMTLLATSGCNCTSRSVDPLLTPKPSGMSTPADTPTSTTTPTRTRMPVPIGTGVNPPDNEVRIISYPPGAEVYLVPATADIYSLKSEDVVQTDNLLGTAPLTHELSPGTYYVATVFSPDLFATAGYDLPSASDPTFDDTFPFDGNPSQNMSFIGGKDIERLSKIYRLTKNARGSETLISIALPLPENQRGQPKPALYPTLATVEVLPVSYRFNDAVVRQAIEDKLSEHNLTAMVDTNMVDDMIEVLLRVGKVKLDTSEVDLIIWMHGTDTTSFSISIHG